MNNSSPFGQSLQGSRSFQNNTQSAPQQMFGGFQPQQSFGGFGSGQGFGGFNPFQGGYGGGFQPQQQFNPFQGGYGGGFQPQGFGGGFNPMFGGIGGLGFNPMMGPQFSMPMQGFNPYQQHVQFQQPQDFGTIDMMYRGGPQMSPEMRQRREQDMRNMERMAQQPGLGGLGGGPGQHDRISNPFTGPGFGLRLPMYGGIGGLGFNPMMGGQFMQPQFMQQQFAQQAEQALKPYESAIEQAVQKSPINAQMDAIIKQIGSSTPTNAQTQQLSDLQQRLNNDPTVMQARNAAMQAQRPFAQYAQLQRFLGGFI